MRRKSGTGLGLENTHFVNPHGLDAPDHYSTAADLAVLGAYAMNNPIFATTVSAKSVRVGNRVLTNHNKLLWQFEGAEGIKTGYTKKAGRILVSSATRNGRRLVAVTINAPDDWNDHKKMLSDGFDQFQIKDIIAKGDVLGYLEVAGGTSGYVELVAAGDFRYSLTDHETPEIVPSKPGFVYAPVVRGTAAGNAYICLDGCVLGVCPVVYGQTVEQLPEEKKSLIQRLFGR